MLGKEFHTKGRAYNHTGAWWRLLFLYIALGACLYPLGQSLRAQTINTLPPRDTMEVGDTVSLSVTVRTAPGAEVLYPIIPDTLAGGLELFTLPVIDTLSDSDTAFITRLRLVVSAYDSGWRVIPAIPVMVRYKGVIDTLLSQNALLYVALSQQDSTLKGELKPLRGPIRQGLTFAEIWPWLLLLLVLAGLSIGVYYFLRWRKRQQGAKTEEPTPPVDNRSALDIALEELRPLLQNTLWRDGQEKLFYTKLSDSLRGFLHRIWGLRTLEETTRSITRQLQREERCSTANRREFQELLELSDLIKFARFTPDDGTCEESVKKAIALVQAIGREGNTAENGTGNTPGSTPEHKSMTSDEQPTQQMQDELRFAPKSPQDLNNPYPGEQAGKSPQEDAQ